MKIPTETFSNHYPRKHSEQPNYVRVSLRGKLIKNVAILIQKKIFNCVHLILTRRMDALVPDDNSFVFGLRHNNRLVQLEACILLRKYSILCRAGNPNLLRGTV